MEALRAAGAETVEAVAFDADDPASHERAIAEAFDRHGDIDVVLVTFGVLGDQDELKRPGGGGGARGDQLHRGGVGDAGGGAAIARAGTRRARRTLLGRAERARRSNFVYGASKAGLDAFAQGLGDELAADGVQVMVVRPGMVRTKMTDGMEEVPFTTTPTRWRRRSSRACAAARTRCGCRRSCASCSPACATCRARCSGDWTSRPAALRPPRPAHPPAPPPARGRSPSCTSERQVRKSTTCRRAAATTRRRAPLAGQPADRMRTASSR